MGWVNTRNTWVNLDTMNIVKVDRGRGAMRVLI